MLFEALCASFQEHRRLRRRRRGRPRVDDVYVRRGHQPERWPWLIRALGCSCAPPCWCAAWRST